MENKGEYRYPGSRPFEDTDIDRKLFFGREREKDDLLQKIIARKLVVLHAESGLGKTSLLNAGVNQLLRDRGFLPLKIRFSIPWLKPVQAIFFGIKETAELQRLDIEPGETDTLWHYFKTAAFWSPDDSLLTPVLILDQFEEFFAFYEPEARNDFIVQLADLVHHTIPRTLRQAIRAGEPYRYGDDPPKVKIVISIRSDYIERLVELSASLPETLENRYRLLPLTRLQAREAITGPAQLEDEQIITQCFRYSEDALNMVLNYLIKNQQNEGSVIKEEIEPFPLQLLCRHIETNILKKAVKAGNKAELEITKDDLGGEVDMHKVFQNFYEDRLAELKPAINKRRVRRLCEKGLISASNRRLTLDEDVIQKHFKVSSELLVQLVDNRLLRMEKRIGNVYYELSHDTLIKPIQLSKQKRWTTMEKYMLLLHVPIITVIIFMHSERYVANSIQLNYSYEKSQSIEAKINGERDINSESKEIQVDLGKPYVLESQRELVGCDKSKIRFDSEEFHAYFSESKMVKHNNGIIKHNPKKSDAYEVLGDHYANKKRFKSAIENYEKVLAINNENEEVYEKLMILYMETGKKEKAIEVFKRALKFDVESIGVSEEIMNALKQKNDTLALKKIYEIALNLKIKRIYEKLAMLYAEKGEKEKMLVFFKRAIKIDVASVGIYESIRDVLKQKNETETLETLYEIALNVKIKDAYHYFQLGNDYCELKKYDAAIASYRKTLKLKPDDADTYCNMAIAQYDKGNYDAARASFQAALKLKPDDAEIYINFGYAQYKKGDYDAAITNYRKSLELKPNVAIVYNNMGLAQYNKGDYVGAIASYQKAVEIAPDNLNAKTYLAELHLTTGRFDKALDLAQQMLKKKVLPLLDDILAMKSIVISSLFCQGNQSQALIELQQLLMVYRGRTTEYKRNWDYRSTKKFITQTKRLNELTRGLLLKMIDLLEAPKKEGDKILAELEKMALEFEKKPRIIRINMKEKLVTDDHG
ncbi:MAG: tetratricopeptide repeat protein [Acidobacteria bacterium]|jgi:tetratricopeptide (TPR) repeat protein|nr:tetratricopeptide repeat protein [Acidobacteriota bacterium]